MANDVSVDIETHHCGRELRRLEVLIVIDEQTPRHNLFGICFEEAHLHEFDVIGL
ncbi:hypothetical protein D3C80_1920600 [compost metagenome]